MPNPRQTGKYGSLFLHVSATPALASCAKFADTYDIRWEPETTHEDCTRKGEGFARSMPGIGRARLTCKAKMRLLSAFMVLADDNLTTLRGVVAGHAAADALPDLNRCAFKLITLNVGVGTVGGGGTPITATNTPVGQQMIQGFGWITRGSLTAVFDQELEDEIEILVDGDWLTSATA